MVTLGACCVALVVLLLTSPLPRTPGEAAAALSEGQIQSVLNLLVSFGVPQSTVTNVSNVLHSATTSAVQNQPAPYAGGAFVDLKANGADNATSVPTNGSATLSWTSGGVSSCAIRTSVPAPWSGAVSTASAGTSTGALSQSTTYTISCPLATGQGAITDSVAVSVYRPRIASFKTNQASATLKPGDIMLVSWQASDLSPDAAVALFLRSSYSGALVGLIGTSTPSKNSLTWTIPTSTSCTSGAPCNMPTGTYTVVGRLYSPASAAPASASSYDSAESQSFTIQTK